MDRIEMMRVFVAVARHGGFTKAASELGMAVQTVSKYVKYLEDRLKVKLFNRTTRDVSLNDTGALYFEQCIELLQQFDETESSVKLIHASQQGKIRISAPTSFGEIHLIPALAEFQNQYPDILIDLDLSDRRVSMVAEGFDLAIRIGQLDDSSMIARKLNQTRISVFASHEYLKIHGIPKHPKDLRQHNCLINPNIRYGKSWPFVIDGEEFQVEVSGNYSSNTVGSIKRMGVAGLGIGMAPYYALSEAIIAGKIVTLFEQYEALTFGIYALYPQKQHLSNRVRTLIDFLSKELEHIK